jgi:hypothetical protein
LQRSAGVPPQTCRRGRKPPLQQWGARAGAPLPRHSGKGVQGATAGRRLSPSGREPRTPCEALCVSNQNQEPAQPRFPRRAHLANGLSCPKRRGNKGPVHRARELLPVGLSLLVRLTWRASLLAHRAHLRRRRDFYRSVVRVQGRSDGVASGLSRDSPRGTCQWHSRRASLPHMAGPASR